MQKLRMAYNFGFRALYNLPWKAIVSRGRWGKTGNFFLFCINRREIKTQDIDKVFHTMSPFTLMLVQKWTQCSFLFNRQKRPDKFFLYQLLIKLRLLISHHENSEYSMAHYKQLR